MVLELTLVNGDPITLHLTGNFAVFPHESGSGSKIVDGTLPDGSWPVKESYTEISERIILFMS